jgi:hypothetical protein
LVRLAEESKDIVEKYVKDGLFKSDIYALLWKANSKNDIMDCFREEILINEITSPKVWTHIINVLWVDLDSIFDSREILVVREILKNNGVVLRTRISTEFLNEYMTTMAIRSLEERGVVDILTLESNEKIVLLSPKFRKKVFNDGR